MGITVRITTQTGQQVEATIAGSRGIIGRSVKCDVLVPDESLSRQHCQIEIENGNFFVTDLGSANGVFINGTRIDPNTKTAYHNYQQLTLGTLDCHIEEIDSGPRINYPQSSRPIQETNEPTITKRVPREVLKSSPEKPPKSFPRKSSPKESGLSPALLAPVLILAAAVYYYLNGQAPETPTEVDQVDVVKKTEITPAMNSRVPDEFNPEVYYSEIRTRATCAGFENYCQSLKLDASRSEGIIKENEEVIVYLNPAHILEEDAQFAAFKKDPQALDLITFYLVLRSPLMDEYLKQQFIQLQIVLLNPDTKIFRIYRFHPAKFNPANIAISELNTKLSSAILTGNAAYFLSDMEKYTAKKDLNN